MLYMHHIYIYIYIVYKGEPGPGLYAQTSFSMGRPPPLETLCLPQCGRVADQKGLRSRLIQHKAVQGSHWGDALQQADSDAAFKSFWRFTFVEICCFLWCAIYLPSCICRNIFAVIYVMCLPRYICRNMISIVSFNIPAEIYLL